MRGFVEKSIIAGFCLYNSYMIHPSIDLPFYFVLTFILSLALDLFNNKNIRYFIYFLFITLCFYNPLFIYYLPLILYNMVVDIKIYAGLTLFLILIDFSLINLMGSIISIYLSMMTMKYNEMVEENKITRDGLKEDTLYLKKYNEQLKIDREKNIHIAILTERNRIARELHDSIGHGISSSILQIEALKVISDDNLKEGLIQVQNTLKTGMDDIRNSIHNLYKESLDLKSKIEELCDEIPHMDIKLVYGIDDELPFDLKFDILSIVKEAITNCVKHSNATKLEISVLSQPKFFSIIVNDNGNKFDKSKTHSGIGLISMGEIASKYNGFLNYGFDNGFKIHITLMKG